MKNLVDIGQYASTTPRSSSKNIDEAIDKEKRMRHNIKIIGVTTGRVDVDDDIGISF